MVWSVMLTQRAYDNLKEIDKSKAIRLMSFFLKNAEGQEKLNHAIFQKSVSASDFPTYYMVWHEGFLAGVRLVNTTKTLIIIFIIQTNKSYFASSFYSSMSVETMN